MSKLPAPTVRRDVTEVKDNQVPMPPHFIKCLVDNGLLVLCADDVYREPARTYSEDLVGEAIDVTPKKID